VISISVNKITELKKYLIIFSGGTLISFLWIILSNEPVQSNDTNFYLHHAKGILANDLSYLVHNNLPPYYWFFTYLISLIYEFAPTELPYIIVSLQALLWGTLSILIYKICKLWVQDNTALICSGIFSLSFESLQWTNYVLSDILYLTLFVIYIYKLLSLQRTFKTHKIIIISTIGLLLLLTRPVGFISLSIGSFILLLISLKERKWIHISAYFVLHSIIGLSLILILLSKSEPTINNDTDRVSPSGYMILFTERFADGTIIDERPAHNLVQDSNEADLVFYSRVFLTRCLYFWSPFISGYSTSHLALNSICLLPIIILGLLGLLTSYNKLNFIEICTLTLPLIIFTIFHSLTLIDYDHRYRVPVLWIMIIFSALIIEKVITLVKKAHQP